MQPDILAISRARERSISSTISLLKDVVSIKEIHDIVEKNEKLFILTLRDTHDGNEPFPECSCMSYKNNNFYLKEGG
jgi:hypothetical protein